MAPILPIIGYAHPDARRRHAETDRDRYLKLRGIDANDRRLDRDPLDGLQVKKQGGATDRWSYLPDEFGDGWLCFESELAKRRLTPIPVRWREFSDPQLLKLLDEAQAVNRPKYGFEDRPTAGN